MIVCVYFPFSLLSPHSFITSLSFVKLLFMCIFVFYGILINTIVFDLRDIEGDKISGVSTIPVRFGEKNTGRILFILQLFFWILFAFFSSLIGDYEMVNFIPTLTIISVYSIMHVFAKRNKEFCGLVVDGEYIPLLLFRW